MGKAELYFLTYLGQSKDIAREVAVGNDALHFVQCWYVLPPPLGEGSISLVFEDHQHLELDMGEGERRKQD